MLHKPEPKPKPKPKRKPKPKPKPKPAFPPPALQMAFTLVECGAVLNGFYNACFLLSFQYGLTANHSFKHMSYKELFASAQVPSTHDNEMFDTERDETSITLLAVESATCIRVFSEMADGTLCLGNVFGDEDNAAINIVKVWGQLHFKSVVFNNDGDAEMARILQDFHDRQSAQNLHDEEYALTVRDQLQAQDDAAMARCLHRAELMGRCRDVPVLLAHTLAYTIGF